MIRQDSQRSQRSEWTDSVLEQDDIEDLNNQMQTFS